MKHVLLASLLALACATGQANDGSNGSVHGPGELSGSVVFGSIFTVALAGSVVVHSVEKVGDGIEVVLKGASNASSATIRFSGAAAEDLSLAAGSAVSVVAMSAMRWWPRARCWPLFRTKRARPCSITAR